MWDSRTLQDALPNIALRSVAYCKWCVGEAMTRLASGNKYHAKRTWSELCQRTFDSQAEARWGEGLTLMEKVGEIQDLQFQVKYVLSYKPRITIKIDFQYKENGQVKRQDVKGVLTRDFRTKLAWLKEQGTEVEIIQA